METIIGLTYYSFDSSWSECLNGESRLPVCAPMNDYLLTPLTILSEPYEKQIDWLGTTKPYLFIKVSDWSRHEYECIYHKQFIVRNAYDQDRIKHHAKDLAEMESGYSFSTRRNIWKW